MYDDSWHRMFNRDRLGIFAEVAVITLAGVMFFIAPYWFPPRRRLLSASYVFGFNNRVAIIALAFAVGVLAVIRARRWKRGESTPGIHWGSSLQLTPPLGIAFAGLAVWYLLLTVGIYFLFARQPGFYKLDWESSVFLWHLRLMDLYHLRPYADFRAEYGPALAYLPYWSYRSLKLFGIADEPSYYALHYTLNGIGLACLAAFMSVAKVPGRYKYAAFTLVGISAFAPQMGLNELALRYLSPYFGLLAVHIAVIRNSSRTAIFASVAAAIGCFVTLSLSPEIGVAYFVATVAYGFMLFTRQRRQGLAIVATIFATGLLLTFVLPQEYFQTFSSFFEGANNFPIVPVPHILLYAAVVLIFIPGLLAARIAQDGPNESFLCALGLLSLALMPGALGRCDPMHTFSYGLGLFALAFLSTATAANRWFVAFSAAYALVFICGLQYSNARVYGITRAQIHSAGKMLFGTITNPRGGRRETPQQAAAGSAAQDDMYAKLSNLPAIGLPYGSYGYEKWLQRFFWSAEKLVPERYIGTIGVYTEADLRQRLADLSHTPRILIFNSFLKLYEHRDTCSEQRQYLRTSLLFLGSLPCLHPLFDTNIELAKYIDEHYRVVQKIGEYYVMERAM